AARALTEAGRRRIGIITGPPDMEQANERARGWAEELTRSGIVPGPIVHGDFTVDSGMAAMTRLLQRAPDLDGVFASSDLMATGALRVLQAAGRRVPLDVSLVGFDDVLIATTSEPPLTTVRQPLEEMGRLAAEALIAQIHGRSVEKVNVLPTSLVRRESLRSMGAPASGDLRFTTRTPAPTPHDGLVVGSGRVGAIVHGEPGRLVISLAHERFFLPANERPAAPDLRAVLPEMRDRLRKGDGAAASAALDRAAAASGYGGLVWTDPLG